MNRTIKTWFLPMVAVAVLLGIAGVRADDAPAHNAVGSITGTVTDAEGHAMANITVNLWPPTPIKLRAPNSPKGFSIGEAQDFAKSKKSPTDAAGAKAAAKKKGPTPISSTVTAADGTYTLAGIPVGDYSVDAGKKDGTGYAKQAVSVREGQVTGCDFKLGLAKK